MRIALDTSIIASAEGINGERNREAALRLMAAVPRDRTVIPVQVLGGLFAVLVRKARRPRQGAPQALLQLSDAFPLAATTPAVMAAAADVAVEHGLGLWDAVMLTVAAEARCRLLRRICMTASLYGE